MGYMRILVWVLGVCLMAGQAQALTTTYVFKGKVDECREDAGAGFNYMRCRFDLRFDIDSASFGTTVNPLAHLRVFSGRNMLASAVFQHYPLYDSEQLPYCNDFCTRATTTRAGALSGLHFTIYNNAADPEGDAMFLPGYSSNGLHLDAKRRDGTGRPVSDLMIFASLGAPIRMAQPAAAQTLQAVPLPATAWLMLAGLGVLGWLRSRA